MKNVIRSWGRFISGKLLPPLAYPVLRGPLKGARFVLGTIAGEGGGATVYVNMSEPEQTEAFVASLRQGGVVYDIGANVGYYTILGSRIVGPQGRVIAVEPALANLSYLYQHIKINKATNVTVITGACSDRVSLAVFQAGTNSATGHLATRTGPGSDAPAVRQPVPTVTVDGLVHEIGAIPDVLKIDVEGAEFSVLGGALATLRESRPTVLLSTHSEELRVSCLRLLSELGFVYTALGANECHASEFLVRHPKR